MNYLFIQNLQIDWMKIEPHSYIRNIPALQFKDSLTFEKNITFFVGENGTGKSTLLEVREYSDWSHPSQEYHKKSHGESFLALAQNSFRPNGLYLLDEPEAALSPQRQLTLMIEMHKMEHNLSWQVIH